MRFFSSLKKNVGNKAGFTLVEVIVTSVIVAILAAVAIPNYVNYVNSQRVTTCTNLAETGAASANSYFRRTGNVPTVAQLNLYYDSTKYLVTVADPNVNVKDLKTSGIIQKKFR